MQHYTECRCWWKKRKRRWIILDIKRLTSPKGYNKSKKITQRNECILGVSMVMRTQASLCTWTGPAFFSTAAWVMLEINFCSTDGASHIVTHMNSSEVMICDMQPKVNIIPTIAWEPICECRMVRCSLLEILMSSGNWKQVITQGSLIWSQLLTIAMPYIPKLLQLDSYWKW